MTWRIRSAGAMAVALTLAAGCNTCLSGDRREESSKSTLSVEVLAAGSGATRLELSPAMTHVAVEIGGDWLDEAFVADWGAVPPVLKVIDTATRTPTVTAQGWIAGPVSDGGEVLIVEEHGEEYRYRMRRLGGDGATLALKPPDGIWLMRGVAFGNAGRSFVVLRQPDTESLGFGAEYRERLWIASIDTTHLKILATTTLDVTGSEDKRQRQAAKPTFAANPVRSELYLLELPEPGSTIWHVIGMDGDSLRQKWRTPIESRKPSDPRAARERSRGALLVVAGAGAQLAVIYGRSNYRRAVRITEIFVLDTASGRFFGRITPPEVFGAVRHPRPVPARPEIALLHVTTLRGGDERFSGISVLDLFHRSVITEYEVSRSHLGAPYKVLKEAKPQAMAVTPAGKVFIAPRRFSWAIDHEPGGPWPEEPDPRTYTRGADRPEVAGFVNIPEGWHRKGRPRVDAVNAWRDMASSVRRAPQKASGTGLPDGQPRINTAPEPDAQPRADDQGNQ